MKPHTNFTPGRVSRPSLPAALIGLFLCLFNATSLHSAVHRWYSPGGSGNGSSSSTPKLFSASDVNSFLDNNSETEFFIHLLPSSTDYEVTTRILIPDHTSLADLKISITGEGDYPEETRLVNKTTLGTGGYQNPNYIIELNRSRPGASSEDAPITALQLVVENLL